MKMGTTRKHAPPLGQLELQVLEYIWRDARGDAKGIHQDLDQRRCISLSTVQSTLDRLFRKQLLTRSKLSHAYIYRPAVSRHDLISRMITDVISTLSDGNLEPALSGLIDHADAVDDRTLERLELMIAQRRKKLPSDR